MKKIFFLLFSAGILFSVSAKAQSLSAPAGGGTDNFIAIPMGGTEWTVSIVVSDSKGSPVLGAKVTLPCSGESFELTDAKGTAVFVGFGSCPCTDSPVNVTTSRSNVNQYVYCGINNVTLPQ
jgi:hypothetical protein